MAGVIFDGKTVAPAILVEKEIVKTKFGASADTWVGDVDENGVLQQTTWAGALDFSGVKEIAKYGLQYIFQRTKVIGADFGTVEIIGESGLEDCFYYCEDFEWVIFSSLRQVKSRAFYRAFLQSKIKTISFPLLTDVASNAFATNTTSGAFRSCSALTEIHFRADMQSQIESLQYYSNKWGATNATIYFDL